MAKERETYSALTAGVNNTNFNPDALTTNDTYEIAHTSTAVSGEYDMVTIRVWNTGGTGGASKLVTIYIANNGSSANSPAGGVAIPIPISTLGIPVTILYKQPVNGGRQVHIKADDVTKIAYELEYIRVKAN